MVNKILDIISAAKSFIQFSKLSSESRKIVFYAEDSQSKNFLIDLVNEISIKFNHEVCYLTSDINDTIFKEIDKNPKLHIFYIGTGFIRTLAFLNLKADLCIMTMPDLDNFHLKKSKIFPVHYLYIFHALVSTHSIYRQQAFDSYNTIFCTGEQQITEIRKTEKIYKLPKKNLYKDGYRPLEFLIKNNELYKRDEKKFLKILIAPTWGENNIFNHCINELLQNLVKTNHEIYLRPHPMTLRDSYDQINNIKQKFIQNDNFFLQEDNVNRNIFFESDILITDWSGVGMEYGLGLLKPVVYIDLPKKNLNPEYKKINITPIETKIRNEIGALVDIDDISKIEEIILNTIQTYKKDNLIQVRNKYVFMKKNGLNKSAKRIITIANACQTRNDNNLI